MIPEDLLQAINLYSQLENDEGYGAKALRGLSRAHADFATLKFWLQLPPGDHPDQAETYALRAIEKDPKNRENGLTLAYAYESSELGQKDKSRTRQKVEELIASGLRSNDLNYLSWHAAVDGSKNFYRELRPDRVSNFRILLDGALYFTLAAKKSPKEQRDQLLERADLYLEQLASVSPSNGLVDFGRAYLATAREQLFDARDHYLRAISRISIFPRARNNLGFVYAKLGDYEKAEEQFDASWRAAASMNPVAQLHNLGYARLELDRREASCDCWRQASQIPGADRFFDTPRDLAFCAYIEGRLDEAVDLFQKAAQLAGAEGLDLMLVDTYRGWGAGPKETELASKLIAMAVAVTSTQGKPDGGLQDPSSVNAYSSSASSTVTRNATESMAGN